jgi:hypothetical protein
MVALLLQRVWFDEDPVELRVGVRGMGHCSAVDVHGTRRRRVVSDSTVIPKLLGGVVRMKQSHDLLYGLA